jgi:hypothetical protein
LTVVSLAESKGTEGNLKRNERDGDLLHIFVVGSMNAPAGLEILGWIQVHGSLIDRTYSSAPCANFVSVRSSLGSRKDLAGVG